MNKKQLNIKLSDNERLKRESNFLRGSIKEDLTDEITGGFKGDNYQLIRFHGMYQQDHRDLRIERTDQKLEPLINMMLRCRLPGGVITSKQWIEIDKFVNKYTLFSSIRLTNRQTLQLHGILKRNLKKAHHMLHILGLDSIATAGDVNRNVLCTSNPIESILYQQSWEWAKKISEHLLPKTKAYAEIWLDNTIIQKNEIEPILGNTYLPRKFKIAIAIPPLNDVDIHANDLNLIAISDSGRLVGFNILVGGGLSITYGDQATYPRKASEFGFINLKYTLKVVEAIVSVQRDWGDRSHRQYAKTKYTLENKGINIFRNEVEIRAGIKFSPIRFYIFNTRGDRFGWVQGVDDQWHLTLFIENGRILDYPKHKLKTGLAEIAHIHNGDFRLTANQNLIIAGVSKKNKVNIEKLAQQYRLINKDITAQRRSSMSCVSFPTCPLAMAEAERFLPKFIDKIEVILATHNMSNNDIILRVSGCPNGCARALLAEIGLIGKSIGHYNLYLGGNRIGTRIPRMYKENITEHEILSIIDNTVGKWATERKYQESYGDYVIRAGIINPVNDSVHDFYI